MRETFPLFPEQASSMAPRVDHLYFYLLLVSFTFATLIALSVIYFAYRGSEGANPAREARNGSLSRLPEMRFQFAECLLDRIEIRRVFGKIA